MPDSERGRRKVERILGRGPAGAQARGHGRHRGVRKPAGSQFCKNIRFWKGQGGEVGRRRKLWTPSGHYKGPAV